MVEETKRCYRTMLPILKNIMREPIYLKVDTYRLYPTKKEVKFLDREFDFYHRLKKYVYKEIRTRFVAYNPYYNNIPSSELRPFVFGMFKKFRESKRYTFSNYLYLDHFANVADRAFSLFESKKLRNYVKKQPNYSIIEYEKEVIKLTGRSLKIIDNHAVFNLRSIKIKVRPKNLNSRNYNKFVLIKSEGRYYLRCIYYKRREDVSPEALACGIDVGIRTNITVAGSDESIAKYNLDKKVLDSGMDRIVKIRQFYRETLKKNGNNKNSKNVKRLLYKLTRAFEKLTNYRIYQYNQIAEVICKKYQYICIENISIEEMYENINLRTQVNKSRLSSFFHALEIKASKYNRTLIKADRYFKSSQICSNCGKLHKEMHNWDAFKDEIECECGFKADRDINAAKNLLNYCIKTCKLNPKKFVRQERHEQLSLF